MSDVPEGYMMSEVGAIPEAWDVIKMGDVFEFKNGLNKEKKYFGHGTPIVNYIDVYKNNALSAKDLTGKVTVTKTELKAYEVRKDDVFFTRTSETVDEIGITSVITDKLEKTVFSGFILRARPKNNWLDTRYKKYCFSSENVRKGITSKSSYTTRALTNGRLLSEVQIPLPPLPEQQAIASALSDVDALIAALEQLITKKRNIKQGAMQQLLTGEKRLPGFGGAWEVKKLNKIADVRDGTHESPKYYKNGVIFITSKNIFGGKIDFTDITYISEDDAITINQRSKVDNGDILMSMIGTIGNAVLINFEPDFCIKNVALIKPFNVYGNYLIQFIHSTIFQKHLNENLDGGIQKFISLGGLRELSIPTPAPTEQQAIAQILSDMDAEIEALKQKRDKHKAIKQGMMQELLTGKTRLVKEDKT
jgi:type I restriction enzyme S subunit